jgi:hypothetical protein
MGVVEQPVHRGACQQRITEQRVPLLDVAVRRDDRGAVLVALADTGRAPPSTVPTPSQTRLPRRPTSSDDDRERFSCGDSSCFTVWLTADVDTPSSRAAPLNLRCRAIARKTWSWGSGAVCISPRRLYRSRPEQHLDCAALVHRAIAVRHLRER